MPTIQDPTAAVAELLKADVDVAALVSSRVFWPELPQSEAAFMPRKAIVVRPAPGVAIMAGSFVEHDTQTVDVLCYGETPFEAQVLRRTVLPVLKQVRRRVINGTLIHWADVSGGATGGGTTAERDSHFAWPFALQSFQVFFAEKEAA